MSRLARIAALAATYIRARMNGATQQAAASEISKDKPPAHSNRQPNHDDDADDADDEVRFLGRG